MDVITGKTRPQSGRALYDQSMDLTTLDLRHRPPGHRAQVSETDGL
jgi:ABC-type uncharacterized transport system ATPase subunit